MIVKVCGIIDQSNLTEIVKAEIDMIGLNFYPKSKRYLANSLKRTTDISDVAFVGVFVNEELSAVIEKVQEYDLDYVQLHGNESPDYCRKLKDMAKVIKVFSIANSQDFDATNQYEEVDFFLFDTKTKNYGGSGRKFDWEILSHYEGDTPFLLAGGIKADDVEGIKSINHPQFAGVDINSRFEKEPGIKNVREVHKFAYSVKHESY